MDKSNDKAIARLLFKNKEFIAELEPFRENIKSSNLSFPYYIAKSRSVFYEMAIDLKTMIHVNHAVKKIWKLSENQCKNNISTWFNTISPEDRARVKKALLNFVTSNKDEMTLEYRLLYDDLSYSYIIDKIILIKDQSGKPHSIMGVASDISEYFYSKKNMFIYEQIMLTHAHENNTDVFFDAMLKIIATSFDWDYAEFWVVDEIETFLYCTNVWTNNKNIKIDSNIQEMKIKPGSDFNGYVAKQKNPVLVSTISRKSKYTRLRLASACEYKSALGVNVKFKDRLNGQFLLFSAKTKVPRIIKNQDYIKISHLIAPIVEGHASDKMLSYQSRHHKATGYLNLYGFELVVEDALKKIKQDICAILIIDLEGLQTFIDLYGYIAGQLLSQEVGMHVLNQLSPIINNVAYISDTKIGLIVEKLGDKSEIDWIIKGIQAVFDKPFKIDGMTKVLTARLGVSFYPDDGNDPRTLIDNANIANNYAKKTASRNCQFYTSSILSSIKRFLDIENALRHAINNNQLHLVYQPKVNLVSGHIVGVEALARWHDPVLGVVSPGEFINVAEQSDLIILLGEWVFEDVMTHFPMLELNIPVSINISTRNLSSTYDLLGFIKKMLKKFNLPGHFIDLELTEYQLAQDIGYSVDVLRKLKNKQVTLSIDDFGTGFSSFEYLKLYKPKTVKIDKSFVAHIPHNLENLGILRAIIALSKNLGIKTIAEGVETKEQMHCLIEEGCDEMQGYYFSKPVSIAEIKNLIAQRTGLK